MTPEQFLKKWLPVAEHVFKDMKLTMKDDLEAVIHYFNDEAGRCIIDEKIGHIDNEEMVRKSSPNGEWVDRTWDSIKDNFGNPFNDEFK
jgi:hypothetical protein